MFLVDEYGWIFALNINIVIVTDLMVGDIIQTLYLQEIYEQGESSSFKSAIP